MGKIKGCCHERPASEGEGAKLIFSNNRESMGERKRKSSLRPCAKGGAHKIKVQNFRSAGCSRSREGTQGRSPPKGSMDLVAVLLCSGSEERRSPHRKNRAFPDHWSKRTSILISSNVEKVRKGGGVDFRAKR